MARSSNIVTNFTAGELSPRLEGRVDLQKYNAGAKTIENGVIFPQGGVGRRPGTTFVANTKLKDNRATGNPPSTWGAPLADGETHKARLVPFEYSDEQTYLLEFGDSYIRIFKDNELLDLQSFGFGGSMNITFLNSGDGVQDRFVEFPVNTGTGNQVAEKDRFIVKNMTGRASAFNGREFVVGELNGNFQGTFSPNYLRASLTNTGLMPQSEWGANGLNTGSNNEYFFKIGPNSELASPYNETEVFELTFTQSADVLYIAHKNHAPRKITRVSTTQFQIEEIEFTDGPYLDENITSTTVYASADTGNITLTASADLFETGHVGALWRFRAPVEEFHDQWAASTSYANNALVYYNGNVYKQTTGSTQNSGATPPVHLEGAQSYNAGAITWTFQHSGTGYVEITALTSATVVDATVKGIGVLPNEVVGSSNATKRWSEGAFSTLRGFPRAVNFYEERLYFAGTKHQPQTLFGSVTADFENHTPGTNDDSAINITIASDQVNVINHLLPGRFLQILTSSAEFTLSGGAGNEPVTPTSVNVLRETTFGSSTVRPLRAGTSTIMVQKGGLKVKEITFDLDRDGLVGVDLTVLANHLAEKPIIDMVWQQKPELILWFVREDGVLIGLSYDPANNVVGWHKHAFVSPFQNQIEVFDIATHVGTFSLPETITGSTSGATATLLKYEPSRSMYIVNRSGNFIVNETITGGTSGATTTIEGSIIRANDPNNTKVESLASLSSGNEDRVYMSMARQHTGFGEGPDNLSSFAQALTVRSIVFMDRYDLESDADNYNYFDMSVTIDNPKAITNIGNPTGGVDALEVTFADIPTAGSKITIKNVEGAVELNNNTYRVSDLPFNTNHTLAPTSGKAITNITKATEGVVTCVAHGFSTGDFVSIFDVVGMTQINNLNYKVTVVDADTFKVGRGTSLSPYSGFVNTSSFGTYTSGGYAAKSLMGTDVSPYSSGGEYRDIFTEIRDLGYLDGENVSVSVNGKIETNKTVNFGAITLDNEASIAHVGLDYTTTVETLRMEAGGDDGTAQGKVKRIHGVTIRFVDTTGAKIGPNLDNLDPIPFRDSTMSMDRPIPFFDGDKEMAFPAGYENDAKVVVQSESGLPMQVTAIIRRSNTFDA